MSNPNIILGTDTSAYDPQKAIDANFRRQSMGDERLIRLQQLANSQQANEMNALKLADERREQDEDMGSRKVIALHGGDYEKAMPDLLKQFPNVAIKIEKVLNESKKARFEMTEAQLKAKDAKRQTIGSAIGLLLAMPKEKRASKFGEIRSGLIAGKHATEEELPVEMPDEETLALLRFGGMAQDKIAQVMNTEADNRRADQAAADARTAAANTAATSEANLPGVLARSEKDVIQTVVPQMIQMLERKDFGAIGELLGPLPPELANRLGSLNAAQLRQELRQMGNQSESEQERYIQAFFKEKGLEDNATNRAKALRSLPAFQQRQDQINKAAAPVFGGGMPLIAPGTVRTFDDDK